MISNLYNTFLNIYRPTLTADADGGFTTLYIGVISVKGRVSMNGLSTDADSANSGRAWQSYKIYLPSDTDIQRGDHVTDGITRWRIISIGHLSLKSHHIECLAEEDQRGV